MHTRIFAAVTFAVLLGTGGELRSDGDALYPRSDLVRHEVSDKLLGVLS